MLKGNELPAMPSNDRIMVRPDPPPDKVGALWVPDVAKVRAHMGVIVHAGLTARDELYDHGHEIGDRVWWGQFAGVIEEWSHITKEGGTCMEHDWGARTMPADRTELSRCACGAELLKEPILVMNVGDILGNETLEQRMRDGEMTVARGKTAEGKTQHYIKRREDARPGNGTTTHTAMVNYGS